MSVLILKLQVPSEQKLIAMQLILDTGILVNKLWLLVAALSTHMEYLHTNSFWRFFFCFDYLSKYQFSVSTFNTLVNFGCLAGYFTVMTCIQKKICASFVMINLNFEFYVSKIHLFSSPTGYLSSIFLQKILSEFHWTYKLFWDIKC